MFIAALHKANLRLHAQEMMHDQPGFYAGFVGTETILARPPDLDAIYYHDDEMAICGMAYLRKQGIAIKSDIGIAGWGAMEAASILPERLTTIEVPAAAPGKMAAELLLMRLRGDAVQDITVAPTRLNPGNAI